MANKKRQAKIQRVYLQLVDLMKAMPLQTDAKMVNDLLLRTAEKIVNYNVPKENIERIKIT